MDVGCEVGYVQVVRLFSWWRLIRGTACLSAGALSAVASGRITLGSVGFCIAMAAVDAYNDVRDVDADRYNQRRDRPIARGELELSVGWVTALMATILSCLFFVSGGLIIGGTLFLFLGYLYSRYARRWGFLSHVLVAAAFACVWLSSRLAHTSIGVPQLLLEGLLVLAYSLSHEFSKSLHDADGDARVGYLTVAHSTDRFRAAAVWGTPSATVGLAVLLGLVAGSGVWYYLLVLSAVTIHMIFILTSLSRRPAWVTPLTWGLALFGLAVM